MNDIEILKLKSQGFCCSQILVGLVLDHGDKENPDLVHFARGLCMGSGMETGTCGILTAGICILAMCIPDDPDLLATLQETYIDYFRDQGPGGTNCKEITGNHYPAMNPDTCGRLLGLAYSRLMSLMDEHDLDPFDHE